MDDDDLFTLDTVRDFIQSKGGKITNHDLVTHFKGFLNDPRRKATNRAKFKDFVNTLATVKLDESGEKVLVLKKKFRDGAPLQSSVAQSTPQKVLDRPKRNKEPSVLQRAPPLVSDDVEEPSPIPREPPTKKVFEFGGGSLDQEEVPPEAGAAGIDESGPAETPDSEVSAFTVGEISQDLLSSPEAEPPRVEESEPMEPEPTEPEPEPKTPEREPSPPVSALVEHIEEPKPVEEEVAVAEPPAPEAVPAVAAPREPTPPVEEPIEAEEASMPSAAPEATNNGTDPIPPVPATPVSSKSLLPEGGGSQSAEKSKQSMSVKERARHINKIHSEGDLHSAPKKHKEKRKDKSGGDKDDDSVNSVTMTLDPTEREWVLKSAAADYHPMAKLLLTHPHLAKRKDFITTALHWAAKHGKIEVVKLLCGTPGIQVNCRSGYTALHLAAMHGHEDIIEMLVQAYGTDPNIRDYSGKKAKQYLRNSASSRTHQLLAARRTNNNANPAPFRRRGSYSAKIQKAGYFGIGSNPAVRNSWASNASDTASEKDRSSPSPSPSPRESPRQVRKGSLKDSELMPPPPQAAARKKKSKRGKESGTSSDSELPRRDSNPEVTGVSPSKSMFI